MDISKLKFDDKGLIPAIVVDAGLAASIFHFGQVQIPDLTAYLAQNNINVRL